MAKRKPVESAETVAAVRAFGVRDPLAQNPDVLAEHFLGWKYRFQLWLLTRSIEWGRRQMEERAPGTYWYLQARTKHIDACFREALADGIGQVVVLGAGYDTRSYQFRDLPPGTRVFEVDIESTQALKKRHLRKRFGELPGHVTFVAIDFNSESLVEVLEAAGYERGRRGLFVWEGVSYYLPERSVISVLEAVRALAAPGSRLVFDYVLQAALDGSEDLYGAQEAMAIWRKLGEPGRFGFRDAAHAAAFMGAHGFTVRSDFGAREMEARYDRKGGEEPHGRVIGCMHLLDAVVDGADSG